MPQRHVRARRAVRLQEARSLQRRRAALPHAHTVRLLEEWSLRRSPGGALPERTALSPLVFGPLTPQMSVLAETQGAVADGTGGGVWRFRTAGALVEDLHGRGLAGLDLAALWAEEDRAAVRRALARARDRGRPWVSLARGETARGRSALLELTFAPATGPFGGPDRALLLHQPMTPLVRLADEPLASLRLCAPEPAAGPLRLVVDNTRPARLP